MPLLAVAVANRTNEANEQTIAVIRLLCKRLFHLSEISGLMICKSVMMTAAITRTAVRSGSQLPEAKGTVRSK